MTKHWIDPSWKLYKRIIKFEPFGTPHSGERQFNIIKKSLPAYNLYNKICSISFDNASNNNACVEKLKCALVSKLDGKIFHTCCCEHIINLAVQDDLNTCSLIIENFQVLLRRIFTRSK